MRIVLDTNVVVAVLISRRGASHWILRRMLEGKVKVASSVPLVATPSPISRAQTIISNLSAS